MTSRRTFLTALGAASAIPRWSIADTPDTRPHEAHQQRGLAAAEDFAFAPGLTYLQTGSLGPTPRPVYDRMRAVERELELNPAGAGYGALEQAMEEARTAIASMVGATHDELVMTTSTTVGMNWIAAGLRLERGDRVLTSDQEHPGGSVAWQYLKRTTGIEIDVVKIAPGEHDLAAIVDRFEAAITSRTRVLSVSHVLSSTGLRMPITALSAMARRHGLVSVVDGAQAPGGIAVNVRALDCDIYATSGHKWMLGPKGTGWLYLRSSLGQRVQPVALEGGRNAYSASSGFVSISGVLGLQASVEYLSRLGMERIEAHNLGLGATLHAALRAKVPKVEIVSAATGPAMSPLLTYRLPDAVKAGDLHAVLRSRHQIEVKVVPGQWLNGHRISTHLFNEERDIDRLISALRAELG